MNTLKVSNKITVSPEQVEQGQIIVQLWCESNAESPLAQGNYLHLEIATFIFDVEKLRQTYREPFNFFIQFGAPKEYPLSAATVSEKPGIVPNP